MARARLLKPGFFTNSALGRLSMGARLVFQGLWCVADREGRLVDDPARLKVEILPYDKVNLDRLLDDLHEAGFIVRFESEGRRFIQVVNFAKHQRPHAREVPSTIPGITQAQPGHDPGTAQGTPGTPLTLNPIPLTPNQIQKPIPAPAAAQPASDPEDPLPPLLRHWERSTGTTVTPALADWLDSELGQATPAEWLRDAIAETGANGSKAWKYTKAIIERWRLHGREPRARHEQRQSAGRPARGRAEEACRVTGKPHDWPNLRGWCERCNAQEPITEESLRRRGQLVE